MDEPRYVLIDTQTNRRIGITTAELQQLLWCFKFSQPLDEAYTDYAARRNAGRQEYKLSELQWNNGGVRRWKLLCLRKL